MFAWDRFLLCSSVLPGTCSVVPGSQDCSTSPACFPNVFWRPPNDSNSPVYYQDGSVELSFHSQVHGHAAECRAKDHPSRTRVKGREDKEQICLWQRTLDNSQLFIYGGAFSLRELQYHTQLLKAPISHLNVGKNLCYLRADEEPWKSPRSMSTTWLTELIQDKGSVLRFLRLWPKATSEGKGLFQLRTLGSHSITEEGLYCPELWFKTQLSVNKLSAKV